MSADLSPAAWLTDLKIGLIFLTRLPLKHAGEISGRDLARATRVNPVVGAIIGAVGAAAFWTASALGLPALLCGLLAVAATILLTGAFHEDGLADVADGFGGGWQREQKLEIMRDSRVGTYGATALILTVALRSAALAALATPELAGPALIAAHAVARSARTSGAPRALYEAAIVRLAMSEHLADIPALLAETASPSPATPGGKKKDRPHERPSPQVSPRSPASVIEPKRLAAAGGALDDVSLWSAVLQAASGSTSDRAKIEHLVCQSFDGRTLRLSVSEAGAAVAGWLGTQADALADLVNRATGQRVLVEIDTTQAKAVAAARDGGRQREAAGRLPAVRQVMEIFDAEIVEVRDHPAATPAAPPTPPPPDTPREPKHA